MGLYDDSDFGVGICICRVLGCVGMWLHVLLVCDCGSCTVHVLRVLGYVIVYNNGLCLNGDASCVSVYIGVCFWILVCDCWYFLVKPLPYSTATPNTIKLSTNFIIEYFLTIKHIYNSYHIFMLLC